jgi:hypothetical protein
MVLAMFLAFSVRSFPTAWPFGVTRREEDIEEAVGGRSWGVCVCEHTYVYIILPGRALATLAQVAARPTQEAESVHDTRHSGNCCRGSRPAFGPFPLTSSDHDATMCNPQYKPKRLRPLWHQQPHRRLLAFLHIFALWSRSNVVPRNVWASAMAKDHDRWLPRSVHFERERWGPHRSDVFMTGSDSEQEVTWMFP